MNDEEAIRHCQAGDKESFRHLVDRYKDVLYGTAYLMTGDHATVEDCVQEAFVSAWRSIGSFQAGRPVKPWLVRIVVNKVLSLRRNHYPASSPIEAVEDIVPATGTLADEVERKDEVGRALALLNDEHRRMVTLRYYTDLSVPEISAVMGCREGTVKSRLHRALEQMRRSLAAD